jgi:hypothetical protein
MAMAASTATPAALRDGGYGADLVERQELADDEERSSREQRREKPVTTLW